MNEGASTSTASDTDIVCASENETNVTIFSVNEEASESTIIAEEVDQQNYQEHDIASVIGKKVSDELKYRMLKNRWQPPCDFQFPTSTVRNLKFQTHWMKEYIWLVYSESCDGAYCNFCVFFSPESVGGNKANALVSRAFNNWKKAKEQFNYHQSLEYHKRATVFVQNFIQVRDKKS